MEGIICPHCGNGNVQELTEEKYKCLACGNDFLVHNLSKEFRQTDEHISEMHKDIKEAINNIATNNWSAEMNATFENAFHLIEIGKYDTALKKFLVLCEEQSATYQSWWGKFLAKTENLQLSSEELICSKEMINCITNMRNCKDYTQEIEVLLCNYLESVFNKNKGNVEQELQRIEKKIEESNSRVQEVEYEAQKLEEEKGNVFQLQKKLRQLSVIQKIIAMLGIGLAEVVVVRKIFFEWIGKSINIIQSPVEEVGFGNAALNFLSIPVKFIIGIVVVIVVASLVFLIFQFIYALFGGKTESQMTASNENVEKMEQSQKDWAESIEADKKIQHKLKKHIELYDKLDFKDLSSLERYISLKKNYTI